MLEVGKEITAMKILNLTPHTITLVLADETKEIQPYGTIARVSTQTVIEGYIDNLIPITKTVFGEVENLPEPEEGTIYIVSSLVAQRCSHRKDVFIPNESVRDEQGRIIGCKSLGRI